MFFAASLSFGLLLAPLALGAVHDVNVGSSNGTLEFSPEAIFADVGDQVVLHFQQKNHSAVQSSFAAPCSQKDGGFNSGFFPVDANVTDNFPTYTFTVNDTQPIWVYCAQAANTAASHCGKGMVFAVNCGPDGSQNSFTNFKQSALDIGTSLAQSNGTSSSATTPTSTDASTPSSSSSTTSSGALTTHTVIVGGNNATTFEPSEVTAQVNDVVVFQFAAKNHTITQSSFASPCVKNATGFDSGFMPVMAGSASLPTYSITVNDTTPVWAYCRQVNHCGMGMVFALNAVDNGPKNFTSFRASAMAQNGTASSSTGTASGASSSSTSASASGAPRSLGVATSLLALLGSVFVFLL